MTARRRDRIPCKQACHPSEAAQQSRVRVSHRAAGGSVRDPAEQGRQRRMELVGLNPPRHAEHVRDVFRSSASGAWSCESGAVKTGEGPISVFTRGSGGGSSAGSL